MNIFLYLLGLSLYTAQATLSYQEGLKSKAWFIPLGMMISVIASGVWFFIASKTPKSSMYLYANVWDAMIAFTYAITPLVLFGVKLNTYGYIGLFAIILGLSLLKIGTN